MSKPVPQREVKVSSVTESGFIFFYATQDAVTEFEQFGTIYPATNRNQYMLVVDERYDFNEVVTYLENYG